jgi:hypothetical protein
LQTCSGKNVRCHYAGRGFATPSETFKRDFAVCKPAPAKKNFVNPYAGRGLQPRPKRLKRDFAVCKPAPAKITCHKIIEFIIGNIHTDWYW